MAKSDEQVLHGSDVRSVFEAVLPDQALQDAMDAAGFQERRRALDGLEFLRAMVISAAQGDGGRQAAVLKHYFEQGHQGTARSSQYGWFSPALERTMERVRDRALSYANSLEPDLPGWIGRHVRDWHIVDSCTVRLSDELVSQYPSTGDHAALKVHKRFSVGVGTTVGYHLSPAREHDARHLRLDESWRGLGLLADLGYASHDLLRHCAQFEVRYVLRLKDNWKPKVRSIVAGDVTRTFLKGADFDALLDEEVLRLSGSAIDANVTLGQGSERIPARLVGVRHEGTYRYYLTNLPRDISPDKVSQLYRVRWEIELDNKLDKSCMQLDEITSSKGHTARALVHASIVASMLVCLLAYHHRAREAAPSARRRRRERPPIHPQAAGRMMVVLAHRIAAAFALEGRAAQREWDFIAERLVFMGQDPNWRRRPSVLDQLRGWIVEPASRNRPLKSAGDAA
jgi:hypothetical protein